MEIIEVSYPEYKNVINDPFQVFGKADFIELNKNKCDSVHYILFKEGKYRLGLTGGIRELTLLSPFSAPFGGFIFVQRDIRLNYIDDAIDKLIEWTRNKNLKGIGITLPPLMYNESYITKVVNCLYRKSFSISKIDLNYAFPLIKFDEKYIDNIWYNARKNLKISFSKKFCFKKCLTVEDEKLAYDVIQKNREARGFPLRMSWEQILSTLDVIEHDFFLLYDEKGDAIASAIIFHISQNIVQVIYWGDLPEYNNMKTMNFLSYKVFEYYKDQGKSFVDIGPSSDNSIPNLGLCEFKESIGCEIQSKFSFTLQL